MKPQIQTTDRIARETFRATPDEIETIRLAAIKADLDRSKLIRRAALTYARKILSGETD